MDFEKIVKATYKFGVFLAPKSSLAKNDRKDDFIVQLYV